MGIRPRRLRHGMQRRPASAGARARRLRRSVGHRAVRRRRRRVSTRTRHARRRLRAALGHWTTTRRSCSRSAASCARRDSSTSSTPSPTSGARASAPSAGAGRRRRPAAASSTRASPARARRACDPARRPAPGRRRGQPRSGRCRGRAFGARSVRQRRRAAQRRDGGAGVGHGAGGHAGRRHRLGRPGWPHGPARAGSRSRRRLSRPLDVCSTTERRLAPSAPPRALGRTGGQLEPCARRLRAGVPDGLPAGEQPCLDRRGSHDRRLRAGFPASVCSSLRETVDCGEARGARAAAQR